MRWHCHLIATFFAGALGLVSTAVAEEAPKKIVVARDSQVLITVKGQLKTIAVGDMFIATGRQISTTEFLVYGVTEGESTLLVFLQDGSRVSYDIRVLQGHPAGEAAHELRAFLGEMPGITIHIDANGIAFLEGRPETQQDADRLKLCVSMFSDVRDRTAPFEPPPGSSLEVSPPSSSLRAIDNSDQHNALQELPVGTQKLVTVEGKLKTVTFGNRRIATGRSISATEFLVVGMKAGQTTVVVKMEDGTRKSYSVRVRTTDPEKTARELRALLGDMEGISVRIVEKRVYAEGDPTTEDDANRLRKALAQYPEVRDLTLQRGPHCCFGCAPKPAEPPTSKAGAPSTTESSLARPLEQH